MNLTVLSDNGFRAFLNGPSNLIGQNPGINTANFQLPGTTITSVSPSYFVAGDNVLTIEVLNQPSTPTGLDVSGTISGYFQTPCRGRIGTDSTE